MNLSDLAELACRMAERGIDEIEISRDGMRHRLVVETTPAQSGLTPISLAPADISWLTAPVPARFRPAHPARAQPELERGADVSAGDIVAYLEAGDLVLPVLAAVGGKVSDIAARDGDLVGYGSRLIGLTADPGSSSD
jgi:biotin carboxyl carrier protein